VLKKLVEDYAKHNNQNNVEYLANNVEFISNVFIPSLYSIIVGGFGPQLQFFVSIL